MSDHRDLVNDVIHKIGQGEIAPDKAWGSIRSLKDRYIETCEKLHSEKDAEQSWHVFIGNSFQNLVYAILKRVRGQNILYDHLQKDALKLAQATLTNCRIVLIA